MLETDEDGGDEGKSDTYVGKMCSQNMQDVLSVTRLPGCGREAANGKRSRVSGMDRAIEEGLGHQAVKMILSGGCREEWKGEQPEGKEWFEVVAR